MLRSYPESHSVRSSAESLRTIALVIGDDLRETLGQRVPRDHALHTHAQAIAIQAVASMRAPAVLDLGVAGRNTAKLLFCGQFSFLARRPDLG